MMFTLKENTALYNKTNEFNNPVDENIKYNGTQIDVDVLFNDSGSLRNETEENSK